MSISHLSCTGMFKLNYSCSLLDLLLVKNTIHINSKSYLFPRVVMLMRVPLIKLKVFPMIKHRSDKDVSAASCWVAGISWLTHESNWQRIKLRQLRSSGSFPLSSVIVKLIIVAFGSESIFSTRSWDKISHLKFMSSSSHILVITTVHHKVY